MLENPLDFYTFGSLIFHYYKVKMVTIEGTQDHTLRFNQIKYKTLGKTGFHTSVCGFGGYRIDDGNSSHKKALIKALLAGINLIDTSSNYADGGSEILVGKVINQLFSENKLSRDELIIVTKGGYMQGKNLRLGKEKEQRGKPFTEVIKCAPDLWHCISPDFLENQISLSLERLQLEKIDVYLLHNPEYYLNYSSISDSERRNREYYRRIKEAFVYLEKEVKNGRISYYGVSSNSFGEKQTESNFTSLEKLIGTAKEISDNNHFAVVQLPLNLIESGGIKNLNQQNETKTFLQIAKENNLGVLVNRPLNAIVKNRLVRLSDIEINEDRSKEEIFYLIDDLEKQEYFLTNRYANNLALSTSERKDINESLTIGKILKSNYNKFDSPNQFKEIKENFLIPRANYAINEIGKQFQDDEGAIRALRNYAVTTNIVLDSIFSDLGRKHNIANNSIHELINNFLNDEQRKLPLSRKAILLINSIPEVCTTLVGMRNTNYVEDMLKTMLNEDVYRFNEFWHRNSDQKSI